MSDAIKNFAKSTVSTGYDNLATSIVLTTGGGAKFPTPSFNVVWWNSTDYSDPSDDPNVEIVRVTNIATDTLTVTRAQESTSASTKNTGGKTYTMIQTPTGKTITDLWVSPIFTGNTVELNQNTGSIPSAPINGFHITSPDGTQVGYGIDQYGAAPLNVFRRADGTQASPTALQASDLIGGFRFDGYNGSAYLTTMGRFGCAANSTWTGSNGETRFDVSVCANGATSASVKFRFYGSGGLSVGTTAISTDPGEGGLYADGANVYFSGVGTTASAANAFLNNASSPANALLRSTSSLRYKRDVEDLDAAHATALGKLRPVWYRSKAKADNPAWSYYGLIAEEVAEIDPRLVHWGYAEESWDVGIEMVEEEDIVNEVGEDGKTRSVSKRVMVERPFRRLKKDAKLVPDAVMYDRVVPFLIAAVKDLTARLAALEAKK